MKFNGKINKLLFAEIDSKINQLLESTKTALDNIRVRFQD